MRRNDFLGNCLIKMTWWPTYSLELFILANVHTLGKTGTEIQEIFKNSNLFIIYQNK